VRRKFDCPQRLRSQKQCIKMSALSAESEDAPLRLPQGESRPNKPMDPFFAVQSQINSSVDVAENLLLSWRVMRPDTTSDYELHTQEIRQYIDSAEEELGQLEELMGTIRAHRQRLMISEDELRAREGFIVDTREALSRLSSELEEKHKRNMEVLDNTLRQQRLRSSSVVNNNDQTPLVHHADDIRQVRVQHSPPGAKGITIHVAMSGKDEVVEQEEGDEERAHNQKRMGIAAAICAAVCLLVLIGIVLGDSASKGRLAGTD